MSSVRVVVGPWLLDHPPVRLHERREAAQLGPAHEQLGRAALDEPVAEVAADVVRPVREAGRGRADRRRHEHAQRPEVRCLVAAPEHPRRLLAGPAAAAEEHAAAGMDLVERALHERRYSPPWRHAASAPVLPSAKRTSSGK